MDVGEDRLRQILLDNAGDSGLDRNAIAAILDHAQIAHFRAGATIGRADKATGLSIFVLSGVVRVMFQGERPEPMIVKFVKAGQTLASIFERDVRPAFSSVAHLRSGVAFVPHEVISNAVEAMDVPARSRFARYSWQIMSDLLRDKCELLTRGVRQRLFHELTILARDFGQPHPQGTLINLALTQDHLARLVVVDRSTLNRKFKELESEGLIFRSGGCYGLAKSTV